MNMAVFTTTTEEHNALVRDSERLYAIVDYLTESKYPTIEDVKILAGISKAIAETTTETAESEE